MAYKFNNYGGIPREHSVNEELNVLTLSGILFLY